MKTAAEYVDSLRARRLELWADGARIAEPTEHPKVRPAVEAIAATYALAHDPRYHALATAHSDLIDARVNRFTHLFRAPEDLVRKVELQRVLGRITGTCFQRCVGMDALSSLYIATWEARSAHGEEGRQGGSPDSPRGEGDGTAKHARFLDWLAGVQRRDEVICGAMTDAKGDRTLRPAAQPDQYLRVTARTAEGVVLRGAKMHQTGAANAHQILVMPGMAMRPGEEDFAIAAAMPVDAPGVTMVLGRQPSDDRKGGPDAGNLRYSGQEVVVLFEDVLVPWERVFLDGDLEASATLVDAFAGFHRASYGGCKPGNLDVLVGASALLAREHGVERASHVRDKLVEMAHLTETVHALGLAASTKSAQHGSGIWQVDPVLANVCKQNVTRMPYEVVRLAEDLAGGLMATLPSRADLDHPVLGPKLRAVVGSEERTRTLRLVEFMTYGAGSVPLRIECMHGAGSPQAQRIVLERRIDWASKIADARRLAGLDTAPGDEAGGSLARAAE